MCHYITPSDSWMLFNQAWSTVLLLIPLLNCHNIVTGITRGVLSAVLAGFRSSASSEYCPSSPSTSILTGSCRLRNSLLNLSKMGSGTCLSNITYSVGIFEPLLRPLPLYRSSAGNSDLDQVSAKVLLQVLLDDTFNLLQICSLPSHKDSPWILMNLLPPKLKNLKWKQFFFLWTMDLNLNILKVKIWNFLSDLEPVTIFVARVFIF